jgi:predicted N-acyltransferase
MASSEITLESLPSVGQISAEDWDACANPASPRASLNGLDTLASLDTPSYSCSNSILRYNPFVSHAFFSAVEASGSACARTGWGPRHLVARLNGTIAGIVPC